MDRATVWPAPLLRYSAVAVLLVAAHVGSLWFHSAGVYQGRANIPLKDFPEDVDVFFVLTFAPTLIGLKYLAYDVAAQASTRRYGTAMLRVLFLAGYACALTFDVACLFSSTKPVADSGLAIWGPVLQSPLFLLLCWGIIAATVLSRNRPPRSSVARSSRR